MAAEGSYVESTTPTSIIKSEVAPNGAVRVTILDSEKKQHSIELSPEAIALLVSSLFRSAKAASKASGEDSLLGQSLHGVSCVDPSAVGLGYGGQGYPPVLVAHFGRARLAIGIPSARELGQALLAAAAPQAAH